TALVAVIAGPRSAHSHADLVQLVAVICAIWVCAVFVSGARGDATVPPESENPDNARDNVWDAVLKIFPGWIWVARPDGTPIAVRQGASEYTGLAAEAVLADGFDCIHPDHRQPRLDLWKKLLKTEKPGELEMRV